MRIIIAIFFLSYVLPCSGFQNTSDYERELSRIADEFKEVIMDEDECDELKDRADYIAEEIEELLEDSEDFSPEEITQFKQLKTKAESVEEFIAVIGGVGSSITKLKDFKEANELMNINLYYISQNEYCVDILIVEIDDYKAYFAINDTTKSFRLHFDWFTNDKSSSGNSKVGMSDKTIRHMLDNRDNALKNDINFKNIECIEFKKWGDY